MRLFGATAKRDANEAEIRAALQKVGVRTWPIAGKGLPDLLCYLVSNGRFFVVEVKTARGTTTKRQQDIPWPIVRSVADALIVADAWRGRV